MGLFENRKIKKEQRLSKKLAKITNNGVVDTSKLAPYFIYDILPPCETEPLKLSAVYAAVNTISNTMSKLPFYVMNRRTKEHIDNSNLYELLNIQPNDRMNASVFLKLMWTWILTLGEAYAIPMYGRLSVEPRELLPIHPENVSKAYDKNHKLFYLVKLPNGDNAKFRYDEIIHLKEYSINGVDGLSPLEYARITTSTGLNQELFASDFYKNYGRPSDYLTTVADLSTKQVSRNITDEKGETKTVTMSAKDVVREEWNKLYTGEGKRFRTAILDNGLTYSTVPQITPDQMDFVNSKTVNVEDIARFFSMASCSFKLGVGKQSYSTNEQGQICYVTETIVPRLRQLETELTLKLLTARQRAEGLVIRGNITAELRGDSAARAAFYDKMRAMGVYNINEMRALEDLPSIGKLGETRLIGANSIPLERLINGESTAQATPNDLSEESDEQATDSEDSQEDEEDNE